MKKYCFLLLLAIVGFYSCEKDDFCIDPVTPNLIVRFYDAANTTQLKSVDELFVWPNTLDTIPNISLDSIAIPLDVTTSQTIYNFSSGTIQDVLTIDYDVEEVFVSRSCGFKAIFNNVNITTTNNWIVSLSTETTTTSITITTVENESAAHVQISH